MRRIGLLLAAVFVSAFLSNNAMACSAFRVIANDGTIISSRTMEFGFDIKSSVSIIPRGKDFTSPSPQNNNGLKWNNKYGYVGINVFGNDNVVLDGMNEAGLAFSGLWYETDMKWQDAAIGGQVKAIANVFLGSWLLGNFSTVDEVKEALTKIKVFGLIVPEMGIVPPIHLAVYDAKGGSIVIEYDNGKLNIYDNPLGIMTNAPNLPWMMTNLRTYVGLSEEEKPAVLYSGVKLAPTGHGNGMLGLPGDITPPSRFARMAVLTHFADKQDDAKGALNLAQHIVNSLDVIKGIAVDRTPEGKTISSESTEWATFRDLTHKIFYFRTYDNLNLRKIDLTKIDFSKEGTISMSGNAEIMIDKTNE